MPLGMTALQTLSIPIPALRRRAAALEHARQAAADRREPPFYMICGN